MGVNISDRVSKHRAGLRALGLRPVQLWVPDTRTPAFAATCRRQSAVIAEADRSDSDVLEFLDLAVTDMTDTDQ